ncbi:MAG TPA: aminoglycoside phosphotransferase family protein [Terriglobia bacterium]|nr:aminoglycoside phosphotransferase family protein [Terriglobia bacterium]
MKSKEFLLSAENLPAYLSQKKLVKDAKYCVVHELGGGVSNIVLLVEWPEQPDRRWVAKQSLGKLRVKDDWRADRNRIFREAEAIRMLRPVLGNSIPELIHLDRNNYLYVMSAAPAGSMTWKESLLVCRRSDTAVAHEVGVLLARLISATEGEKVIKRRFGSQKNFEQLRIDPYYRTTASRHKQHPGTYRALQNLIEDSSKIRFSIVHGDFSPKNILVHGRDIFLIDFEVVHWGDPSFDSGFLLNHLFLKAFHRPQFAPVYLDAARVFWKALRVGMGPEPSRNFEYMTIRHVGALMLARIDGKSPVEYIQDHKTKQRVRGAAKYILNEPPSRIGDLLEIISNNV